MLRGTTPPANRHTQIPPTLYQLQRDGVEGCPDEAKHSIVYRIKRNDVYTEEKRTVRLCDLHFYEAKNRNEFIGDHYPEFREGRIQ